MKNNVRRGLFHPNDIRIIGPMLLRAQCPLLCQPYHGNLLDRPLAPSVLLVPLLMPIPEQIPSQNHLGQARLDMPRRKSFKIKQSSGSIQRMKKKIMSMCLGNQMRPVSWLVAIYLFWEHVELTQCCCSHRASYADSATKYTVVEQVMGKSSWPSLFVDAFVNLFYLLAW